MLDLPSPARANRKDFLGVHHCMPEQQVEEDENVSRRRPLSSPGTCMISVADLLTLVLLKESSILDSDSLFLSPRKQAQNF
jgi:hypothetical protein